MKLKTCKLKSKKYTWKYGNILGIIHYTRSTLIDCWKVYNRNLRYILWIAPWENFIDNLIYDHILTNTCYNWECWKKNVIHFITSSFLTDGTNGMFSKPEIFEKQRINRKSLV